MALSSRNTGPDDSQCLADLDEIDLSAQDAKTLFPELELMAENDYAFNNRRDDADDILNYDQLQNENDRLQEEENELKDLQDFSRVVTTDVPAPPISHSNPETPNGPFDCFFEDAVPPMQRVASEQSILPSLTSKYHNVQPQTRLTDQIPEASPFKMNSVDSHDKSHDKELVAPSPSLNSTVSWGQNPHQAGLNMGIPLEPGARQSHMRTPIRPSNLRNAYSMQSPNVAPASLRINNVNHQQLQTGVEGLTQYPSTGLRSRRRPDADLYTQPQMVNNEMYGAGHFNGQSSYPPPHFNYSQVHGSQVPFIPSNIHENLAHGNMAHGNTTSTWRENELMLQQSASLFQNQIQSGQLTAYIPQHGVLTKQEQLSPDQGAHSLHYRSFNSMTTAMDGQNLILGRTTAPPTNDEEDKPYIAYILECMTDTSVAEDNVQMKNAWTNHLNDREALAEVAADILKMCKLRVEMNQPFKKGGKSTHQFENFWDRFEALCHALRTQKTMCKHLMRQPYIEEIIDDPPGAVARIANNRKVNKGKKAAIEQGRLAMNRKAKGKSQQIGRSSTGDDDDELDAEHDSDQEDFGHDYAAMVPNTSHTAPRSGKRGRFSSSEDTNDHEGPRQSKRAKHPAKHPAKQLGSRSKYQLNEKNEMVDTSAAPFKRETHPHHPINGGRETRFQQPYGGIVGQGDPRLVDPSWGYKTNNGSDSLPAASVYPSSDQHPNGTLRQNRHIRRS